MTEEWTDWIEHHTDGCPVTAGTFVHVADDVKGADGFGMALVDITFSWRKGVRGKKNPASGRRSYEITRYRIRKPRALLKLIELAENLPEEVAA